MGVFTEIGDKVRVMFIFHLSSHWPFCWDISKARAALNSNMDESGTAKTEIDILKWMNYTALDLIGEAGLGYSFNSLSGLPNEYNTAIKSLVWVLPPWTQVHEIMSKNSFLVFK